MVFSAFNISRTMVQFTGNSPGSKIPNRPVAGGSFTPNTMESFIMLRSQLDNQFESAFVTKYKSLMQNRLNSMADKLRSSYSNLLNISMGQQIGENAQKSVRSDIVMDGKSGAAVKSLAEVTLGDDAFTGVGVGTGAGIGAGADGLSNDGITGYSRNIGVGSAQDAQFRFLSPVARAAADMAGKMKVTMRTEEEPPDDVNNPASFFTDALAFAFGGPPDPTQFNQKVSDYETTFNVGGFWSAVNYLYNFSPRQIRYTYGIGHSANSNEAGNKNYLVDGKLIDGRDIAVNEYTDFTGNAAAQNKPERVKWAGMDPTQGYTTEISGTQANYGTVTNRQKVLIDRTDQFGNQIWHQTISAANGDVAIQNSVRVLSGSKFYAGTNETASGMLNTNVEPNSKLIIENDVDYNVTSTLFMNHYEMETRTVDFNTPSGGIPVGLAQVPSTINSVTFATAAQANTFTAGDRIRVGSMPDTIVTGVAGNTVSVSPNFQGIPTTGPAGSEDIVYKVAEGTILATSGMTRSFAVDGSKNYQVIDTTRSISAGSSKISKNFTGKFTQAIHKIHSVNNQDVVSNAGPHDANTGAPLIGNFEIAKYEGFMRSLAMSRGLIEYEHPTAFEINASKVVPTDWVNAEMLVTNSVIAGNVDQAKVWYPFVKDTIFDILTGGNADLGYSGQTVQMRNSFELSEDELLQIEPIANWTTGADGVLRPSFTNKSYQIDIDLGTELNTGAAPNMVNRAVMYVNGLPLPPDPAANFNNDGGIDLTGAQPRTIDIGPYLKAGNNSITVQIQDSTGNVIGEGMSIVSNGANNADVTQVINDRIITGYVSGGEVRFADKLERPNMAKILSRWQARLVPPTVWEPETPGVFNNTLVKNASNPIETGSSTKATNSFSEILMQHINDPLYQDVYRLGLFSKLNKLLVQGNGQTPSGASLTGSISTFFDFDTFFVKVDQDKLVSKAG